MAETRSTRGADSKGHSPSHHTLSTSLIDDYDLFRATVPHHDEMQAIVGKLANEYALTHVAQPAIFVLEGGTGTGLTTEEIVKSDPRIRLTTVDIEPGMIEQARVRLRRWHSTVTFIPGDILDVLTGTASASVDIFATAFTLHHLARAQWPMLSAEVLRVLKLGGVYLNADKIAHADPATHRQNLREQVAAFQIFTAMGKPELQAQWTVHYQEDERGRVGEADQIHFLREAGFPSPRVVWRRRMEAVLVAKRPPDGPLGRRPIS